MKRSSKLPAQASPRRRPGIRPLLELLENRLQPGSMVLGQGAGWSLLADHLSILDQGSARSAVLSETNSESQPTQQPSPWTTAHASDPQPVSVPSATIGRNQTLMVPGQSL